MCRTTSKMYPMFENRQSFILGTELFQRDVQDLPMLVEPFFPATGTVAIAGESGLGKSSYLFQLGLDVVSGSNNFLGYPLLARHKQCIIVSTEDDENATANKLQRYKNVLGIEQRLLGLRFLFDTSDLFVKLEEGLRAHPIDLLVVDCFADLCEEDMNTSNKIRNYINKFSLLASKYGFLVFFLHHSKKSSQYQLPSKDNLLGSQGFEAKCRLVIELRRDLHDSSLRHMCVVKANYLPQDFIEQSFVLAFNERQEFANTGDRANFADLVASKHGEKGESSQSLVCRCLQSGIISSRDITANLNQQGVKIGKSTVATLMKKCPSVQNPMGEEVGQ